MTHPKSTRDLTATVDDQQIMIGKICDFWNDFQVEPARLELWADMIRRGVPQDRADALADDWAKSIGRIHEGAETAWRGAQDLLTTNARAERAVKAAGSVAAHHDFVVD
jgi:hypothetical protein